MTDFHSLQIKVNDLKAKVIQNSITPNYLGSLLEEIITFFNTLVEVVTTEIRAVKDALTKESTDRAEADSALGARLTPVEAKTSAMVLCDGILDTAATPTRPGLYLQRDSEGDLIQIVSVTGDGIDRSIPVEGKIYVCDGRYYQFNGIILEPAGHAEFVFDGGDAFSLYPEKSPEIGGGTPATDYTVAKIYDGGGAR